MKRPKGRVCKKCKQEFVTFGTGDLRKLCPDCEPEKVDEPEDVVSYIARSSKRR